MRPSPALALLAALALSSCLSVVDDRPAEARQRCRSGERIERTCGMCGTSVTPCVDGTFGEAGPCVEPPSCGKPPTCTDGATQRRACGACSEEERACADGVWGEWSGCGPRDCASDAGVADAAAPVCADGDRLVQDCAGCGQCERPCVAGSWGAWSTCGACADASMPSTDAGLDAGGSIADGSSDAGAGQDASVESGDGGAFDGGSSDAGTCASGTTRTEACGNCGTHTATCVNGAWAVWSRCAGEGFCAPGAVDTGSCGSAVGACNAGTRSRTCTAACTWSAWSSCGGAFAGPKLELCGDGLDNDCDGESDEGCACQPVAPGSTTTFTVSTDLARLVPDPARCMLYGLSSGSPTQVVFFDTATKKEVASLTLAEDATDLDLSPDGRLLAVAQPSGRHVSLIDPVSRLVTGTYGVAQAPDRVEIFDEGRVFYTTGNQWMEVHRASLTVGTSTDVKILDRVYWPDIELSGDGALLFVGESSTSGGKLYRLDATSPAAPVLDVAAENNYGYAVSARQLYAAPNGRHVYFAQHQFDGASVANDLATTGGPVFAEDRSARFAVSASSILDAETLRPVASLGATLQLAALAAGDLELWSMRSGSRQMTVQRVDDLIGSATFGKRELTPGSLSSYLSAYGFVQLLHHPVRPVLYGLRSGSVVAFSTSPLAAIGEINLGTSASRMSIDRAGDYLYVGFAEARRFATVDLKTFTFAGYVPAQVATAEIATLAYGQLAYSAHVRPSPLVVADATTGTVVSNSGAYDFAELAAGDGGATLYVGSGQVGPVAHQLDVARGSVSVRGKFGTPQGSYFTWAERFVHAAPGGGPVFFAYDAWDAATRKSLYPLRTTEVTSLTPDGRLAITGASIRRASDGTVLGTMPSGGHLQAISSDGQTVFILEPGSLTTFSLAGY